MRFQMRSMASLCNRLGAIRVTLQQSSCLYFVLVLSINMKIQVVWQKKFKTVYHLGYDTIAATGGKAKDIVDYGVQSKS